MNDTVVRKNKSGGLLIGIIFIIAGILLLWFNEGRTVKTAETISQAEKEYIDISPNYSSTNNGKLIATKGQIELSPNGSVDTNFNISVSAAKLDRTVEMYQWKETCNNENNNEVCTYKMVWDDDLINSNNFADTSHTNPDSMLYDSASFYASGSKLGDFILSDELLKQLNANKRLNIQDNDFMSSIGLKVVNQYYTNVQNNTPKIGDIRISYKYSDAKNVSVLAVQNNNNLETYKSDNGYTIYELKEGSLNGEQILEKLTNENNNLKWILRLIGTFFTIIGFVAIVAPIQRFANYIPIIGTIFGWVSGLASLILGLGVSIIVIALAWLRYRPLLSIAMLLAVIIVVILTKKLKSKKVNTNIVQNNINQNNPN